MLQKNVTAVAYVGDNSRNFEYQKRYQQILYKNWPIGKNGNSILKILSHCQSYLQIAQKSKPFFLPTCWIHREPVLIKRNPQHMYVYDDEDI